MAGLEEEPQDAPRQMRLLAASLPRSPREDDMLEGKAPLDEPTDMRLTLNAVVEDQLGQALDNLLHAAGSRT